MNKLLITVVLATVAGPALAHTGHETSGFAAGLAHPVFGTDHLLAMVAVGLWAALAAPKLVWVAPAGFLLGMLIGGLTGYAGFAVQGLEALIVGSVVVVRRTCNVPLAACPDIWLCNCRYLWRGTWHRPRRGTARGSWLGRLRFGLPDRNRCVALRRRDLWDGGRSLWVSTPRPGIGCRSSACRCLSDGRLMRAILSTRPTQGEPRSDSGQDPLSARLPPLALDLSRSPQGNTDDGNVVQVDRGPHRAITWPRCARHSLI